MAHVALPPLTGALRTCANASDFKTALEEADPGDRIVLTAVVSGSFSTGRSGFTICCGEDGGGTGKPRLHAGGIAGGELKIAGRNVQVIGLDFDRSPLTVKGDGCKVLCNLFRDRPYSGDPERPGPACVQLSDGKDVEIAWNEVRNWSPWGVRVRGPEGIKPHIHHNWFHDCPGFPPGTPGVDDGGHVNGTEKIQVGTDPSTTDMRIGAVVEFNLLERVDTDSEIISVKSGDNTIRSNTARKCKGRFVNRHGEDNRWESNLSDDCNGFDVLDRGAVLKGNEIRGGGNYQFIAGDIAPDDWPKPRKRVTACEVTFEGNVGPIDVKAFPKTTGNRKRCEDIVIVAHAGTVPDFTDDGRRKLVKSCDDTRKNHPRPPGIESAANLGQAQAGPAAALA